MRATGCRIRLYGVATVVVGLLAFPAALRAAAAPPPAPGVPAGAGHLEGTEIVDDGSFLGSTGALCLIERKSIYGLRGVGTYKGKAPSGQEVVYRAAVDQGQPVYSYGPLEIQVENIDTYYMDPYGTHGTDSSCSAATIGDPVPAEFRIFASDHVYRLDGTGAQAPCPGHGSFARGDRTDPINAGAHVRAAWTLDADCTVVGNAAGTLGTGIAPALSPHAYTGLHDPCFSGSCSNNIRVDYNQYFPFKGLYVSMGGPSSAQVASTITVTAAVTNDGVALPNASVAFAVAGPTPSVPPAGAAVTAADGTASFTFAAASAGRYTVTATATNSGVSQPSTTTSTTSPPTTVPATTIPTATTTSLPTTPSTTPPTTTPSLPPTASGTLTVEVTDVPPPPSAAMAIDGPARWHTEDAVTLTATFTDAGSPLPGDQVTFMVAGPTEWQNYGDGQPYPASGSATTDQNGQATFSFSAGRAGDYTVSASSTLPGLEASATHVVHLDIKTLHTVASVPSSANLLAHSAPGFMDPAGRYAYFGRNRLERFDLSAFQASGFAGLSFNSAVIDPAGRYAYLGFGNQVTKVDLQTLQQVDAISLRDDEGNLSSAVVDPAGRYAYFGTQRTDQLSTQLPGRVIKVDLETFQRVDAITFPALETALYAAVMDPAGRYAYFASDSSDQTSRLVKVDLATFQRVGAAALDGKFEAAVGSAVIDPAGRYAYIGTQSAPAGTARVVKVDLDRLQRVGAITMDSKTTDVAAAVMDPAGRYAYFGAGQTGTTTTGKAPGPSAVLKVELSTFEVAETGYFPAAEVGNLLAGVIDPAGTFAYFWKAAVAPNIPGTSGTSPAAVVKVGLSRPPAAWLAAGNDSYTTPYASPLTVPSPGVLSNDHDTQDNDPLAASLVKGPAHGDVTLNPNGSFTYTPALGFSGTDTFTYKADDAMNVSAPATVSVTVAAPPQGVQAVSGGALGFETNVSLFGGPASVKGGSGSTCGQTGQPACADGQSPAVSLAAGGGDQSATDPDGNLGQYGPAYIFENHGPLSVHSAGTTGPTGSVASSASVKDVSDNDPFHAGAPDGEVSSTCRASQSGLVGSARIVNGRLVTSTNPSTGDPTNQITFAHTWDPAPNTTYNGTLNHVGDSYRIVFNEQVLSPDAITVNAVHMYLLGPTAVGDMIIGQSRCGVSLAAANAAPVANADAYTAPAGRALVVAAPGVLANDTDPEAHALTAATQAGIRPPAAGGGAWTFPSDPAHGSLSLGPDGSFTYTPTPGFSGTDAFTYLATDARGRSSSPATVTVTVPAAPALRAVADFDGSGASDVSVFRPSDGGWYAQGSVALGYGAPGDIAVPADYDGDGRTDVAVFRPGNGVWYVHGSAGADVALAYGANGDIPVPADYDGDGKADMAVFRSGVWYIHNSAGGDTALGYGTSGDIPVPADYDGDAKADVAVFRPSQGAWYIRHSTGGADTAVGYGTNGDIPVVADYDGDAKADIAVFRPSEGVWYVQGGSASAYGANGDIPVPADYDGDGHADIAVFRPSQGVWYIYNSGGGDTAVGYGANRDVPAPLAPAIRLGFF